MDHYWAHAYVFEETRKQLHNIPFKIYIQNVCEIHNDLLVNVQKEDSISRKEAVEEKSLRLVKILCLRWFGFETFVVVAARHTRCGRSSTSLNATSMQQFCLMSKQ
jgi:hypothetical protein